MTDAETNRAIAEALGWAIWSTSDDKLVGRPGGTIAPWEPIPDYANDLNATRAVIRGLPKRLGEVQKIIVLREDFALIVVLLDTGGEYEIGRGVGPDDAHRLSAALLEAPRAKEALND